MPIARQTSGYLLPFRFLVVLSCIWALPSRAADVTIKVGVYENAPIVYPEDNNVYRGPSVEILEHIARKEGWTLEQVPCHWAECLELLEAGEIDLQVYIALSKERKNLFDFNRVPLMSNWGIIFTSPNVQVTSIFDLEGKKVALMENGIHALALLNLAQKFDISIDTVALAGHREVLRHVESGRADAGVTNRVFGLTQAGNYDVLRTPLVFNPIEIHYATTKGRNPEILAAIDTHLTALKADHNSVYYQSFERVLPSQISPADFRWLWQLLLGVGGVLAIAAGAVVFARQQVRKKTRTLQAATDALRISEENFRSVFEKMPDVFYRANMLGEFTMVSPSCFECFGYTAEELIGKKVSEIYEIPEQRDTILTAIHRANGEPVVVETDIRRKDGRIIAISTKAFAQFDDHGNMLGVEGIARDITGEKAAADVHLRAQKMNAVGQLTGGIAHDFNNILGIVMGNLELIKRVTAENHESSKFIDEAIRGTRRGADITRKLLSFTREETSVTESVSPNVYIQNIEDLIAKSLTVAIKTELRLAGDLWNVKIDPGELEDALLNMALNARDAMPDGGALTIETKNVVVDENHIRHNPSGKTGEFVMIAVSDTGVGMSSEVRSRIFDPFYTTKEEGKGTGLGLSMVYGFVSRSGGYIDVFSEPGKGTRLCLYLPRTVETVSGKPAMIDNSKLPRGTELLLLVDDEVALTDIAAVNLQNLGYKTLTANSGKQALQILEDNPGIELMFCDIIMPGGLDGYQVALRAHDTHPTLKMLLTSGIMKDQGRNAAQDGEYFTRLIGNLVAKPYRRVELATAVRRALDA